MSENQRLKQWRLAPMGLRIDYPVLDTIRSYVSDNDSTQSRAPPSDGGSSNEKFSREYSGKNVEWAVKNGIINEKERAAFFHKVADIKKLGHVYNQTVNGDYIIDMGNKLLFTDADWKSPSLYMVVTFEDSFESSMLKAKEIVFNEAKRTTDYNRARQIIGDTYWDGYVEFRNARDYKAYGRENTGRKGTDSERDNSKNDKVKLSQEPNPDELQAKINSAMTMSEAKRMIESAFKINGIYRFYDGKYRTADEWLRAEGSSEVELYIENEWTLQEKYINSNQDILDGEYYISDVLDAYLEGTLVGKEKPKAKRFDTSVSYGMEDSRFYSPRLCC